MLLPVLASRRVCMINRMQLVHTSLTIVQADSAISSEIPRLELDERPGARKQVLDDSHGACSEATCPLLSGPALLAPPHSELRKACNPKANTTRSIVSGSMKKNFAHTWIGAPGPSSPVYLYLFSTILVSEAKGRRRYASHSLPKCLHR